MGKGKLMSRLSPGASLSPAARSLDSTGSRWASDLSRSSLLALITRVPTTPSRSSAESIAISSSCWSASTLIAGPATSSAPDTVCFSRLRVAVRLLTDSIARMMSAFWSSSVPTTSVSERQQVAQVLLAPVHRLVELPGDGAELGHATAAEQERQRAEHLLDLGVPAGRRQRDVVALAEPARRGTLGRRLQGDVLLTEQADLADLGDRVVGQVDVLADQHRDLGVPTDPLDVGDLADGDVVDHHRRLRDDVEDVLELRGHGDRVVGVDRSAGQRQVVGAVELARRSAAAPRRRAGRASERDGS